MLYVYSNQCDDEYRRRPMDIIRIMMMTGKVDYACMHLKLY
jgi:hypothetical protein